MAIATRSPPLWRRYLPAESAQEIAPSTAAVAAEASTTSISVKPRCQFFRPIPRLQLIPIPFPAGEPPGGVTSVDAPVRAGHGTPRCDDLIRWLGREDSNLRYRIQSPLPYPLATPQSSPAAGSRVLPGRRPPRPVPILVCSTA